MDALSTILAVVIQLAILALVLRFLYKTFVKSVAKGVISHTQSPKIVKSPQQEVAETVRYALRTGVSPAQIQDIIASEVSAYHLKATKPTAIPATE